MRKIFIVCIVSFFMLSWACPGHCSGPIRKLERGISNLTTAPLEIFNRMFETGRKTGVFNAMTFGFLEGVSKTVFRAAVGVYEVLTFPFPVPQGYRPIVKDPEFFWPVSPETK